MKTVITTLLILASTACGSLPQADEKANKVTPSPTPSATPVLLLDFANHVNPPLKTSCGGAICHGAGSPYGIYVDKEDLFLAAGPKVIERLNSTDNNKVMPKYGFPVQLKSNEKANLLNFLKERGIVLAVPVVPTPGTSGTPNPTTTPVPVVTQAPAPKLCVNVSDSAKATGAAMTFAALNPLLITSCGGGGCHSGATGQTVFVGVEAKVNEKLYSAGMLTTIQNNSMPKGRTMSLTDKNTLFAYLCGRHDY